MCIYLIITSIKKVGPITIKVSINLSRSIQECFKMNEVQNCLDSVGIRG